MSSLPTLDSLRCELFDRPARPVRGAIVLPSEPNDASSRIEQLISQPETDAVTAL